MGRAPCCDKANVKKGPWSPEEDAKLKAYIDQHGTGGNWIALPHKIGLKRCGKSCRLRWLNYLRPNIKHGGFSEEEDNIICSLYISIGSRWSIIAAQLPGRTDNDIKNYWNTRLKKKLLGKQRKEQQARRGNSCLKQEMIKREIDQTTSVVPAVAGIDIMMNNQTPYWPELPFVTPPLVSSQQDQSSLKDLLIKLGGRFSDGDHFHQQSITAACPFDASLVQSLDDQLLYESNTMSLLSIASPTSMNSSSTHLPNTQYNVIGAAPNMSQGLANFPFEQLNDQYAAYANNHQHLEEFERLYVSGSTNGNSTSADQSSSWEDMSSLVYSTMVSDYETCQENVPQDSTSFEDERYFGHQ